MNKAELITAAAEKAGLSKKDTEAAINAAIDAIVESLVNEDKVQLVGFGAFEVKKRAERIGREEARRAHRPQPQDQGEHQDPRLQGPRLQARQGSEGRRLQVRTVFGNQEIPGGSGHTGAAQLAGKPQMVFPASCRLFRFHRKSS